MWIMCHVYECISYSGVQTKSTIESRALIDAQLMCLNDVIMSAMASQINSITMLTQAFVQAQMTENIKAPRHWPLCGEFPGDR